MKQKKFNKLKFGVYRVYWKSGGTSLASVGMDYAGNRWIAPVNWTGESDSNGRIAIAVTGYAPNIKKMELIATS